MDHFHLKIADLPLLDNVTKRFLVSDAAKTCEWYYPCTIMMKILFQWLQEIKVNWDDEVPESICESWLKWPSKLSLLSTKYVPRCYYNKRTSVASMELHGFSDASEQAHSAVVYLRMEYTDGSIRVGLVSSKTNVAPIKRLTIPHLKLCRAQLLAQFLHHVWIILDIPLDQSYAWTNSTIIYCATLACWKSEAFQDLCWQSGVQHRGPER